MSMGEKGTVRLVDAADGEFERIRPFLNLDSPAVCIGSSLPRTGSFNAHEQKASEQGLQDAFWHVALSPFSMSPGAMQRRQVL